MKSNSNYEVRCSKDFGRYLVASKDLPRKHVILIEEPLIFAPADEVRDISAEGQASLCFGCCGSSCTSAEDVRKCTFCNWPICSLQCEKIEFHQNNECRIFRDNKVAFPPPFGWPILNKSILVLRCLLMKEENPRAWMDFFGKLEHHRETRSQKLGCYKGDEMIVRNINYFYEKGERNLCPFTEEEIVILCGIINVNAFCAIKTDDDKTGVSRRAKCLFEEASLLAHSCSPNCAWDITLTSQPPLVQMVLTAATPIKKGAMLTIFYSTRYAMYGTVKRIVSMEEIAHFVCKCSRCRDKTELGTYMSAIKCFECELDYLLPEEPTDIESRWKCMNSLCEKTESVQKIVYMICKVEDHVENIRKLDLKNLAEVEQLQKIFVKYSGGLFHENHYVLQEISTRIVQLLLEEPNIINEVKSSAINIPLIELFISHCRYLLRIAHILFPAINGCIDTLEIYLEHAEKLKRKNI